MTSSVDKPVDLMQYLRTVWRRKGLIILCTTASVCTAFIALTFIPRAFESRVTLLYDDRQPLGRELEAVMGGSRRVTAAESQKIRMSQLVNRVRSRPFLEQVVRLLRMHEDRTIRAAARERIKNHPELDEEEMAIRMIVQGLQARIQFETLGSGVFSIIVADFSAENAQLLARWISGLFVDTQTQNSLSQLQKVHDFGSEQLRIYEEQLRLSEEALAQHEEIQIGRRLSGSTVHSGNVALAEALLQRVSDEAASRRIRIDRFPLDVMNSRTTVEDTVLRNAEVRALTENLETSLRDELTNRLSTGTEPGSWPPQGTYGVLRRGLLQQIEASVREEFQTDRDAFREEVSRYAFLKVDLEAYRNAAAFLSASIAQFKQRARSEPKGTTELRRLETEVDTNRRLLESFRAQMVATDVRQAVEITDLGSRIEILDPASLALSPSRPNRRKILLAALFLGPIVGIGFAFLGETIDPTLRTLDDFTRVVPEPILGMTPALGRVEIRRSWIRKYWVPVAFSGVVVITGAFFIVRANALEQLARVGEPIQAIDPGVDQDEDS